jgi:type II secretory pathway pseudopilin PulG
MTRQRRGHTLLEVFLAMILLTLIIFAIASLYPGFMGALRRSHEQCVGSNLDMQQIECSRQAPFDSVTSAPPVINNVDQAFQTTVLLDPATPLGDPNLKHITVVTRWSSSAGVANTALDYVDYNFLNPP